MEFVKTNVDPSMKTDDEFIEFCAPFAKLTSERGISPDRFVEILFEVLHSLAQLNQIERPTLIVCINVGVMKILNDTKDQPAALPGAEDTEMDAPEDDFADDEMAAGEAAKNDEPVAAADAIDRMVVSALLEKASTSTDDKVKEVMAYMASRQAKGHSQEQPQYDRPRGQANFALPPQEVQFNFAQARDEHHPANRWAPNEVCNNCRQTGHKWRECPSLPHQYMPAPQAWGGPSGGRGRGRGMAGRSRGRGYGY
ncbi:hypothetical protein WJX79_004767 [Trebouxia sp. C0005]